MRIRSGYSFKTAYGKLDEVIGRLGEIEWKVAPICDRYSTYAFSRWRKAAKAADLRPIYGVELGVVQTYGEKKPAIDYWSFFAKDDIRAIHDLIYKATFDRSEGVLTVSEAMEAQGVVKIATGLLGASLAPGDPDLYVALSPSTSAGVYRRVRELGMKLIASSDNFYPRNTDLNLYRLALGRRADTHTYPRHILSDQELYDRLIRIADPTVICDAIDNRNAAMDACQATLRTGKLLKPEITLDLRTKCVMGAGRLGVSLTDPVYRERLDRELAVIEAKDFADYFYIVADIVTWARKHMMVGPARGSSCGSLVCYLLGITTIDPIPYGLIFERFIDLNRADLPDVDVDVSDVNREHLFAYVREKYGHDHSGRLAAVGTFLAKGALNQAGAALLIPRWRIERMEGSLIHRAPGDDRFDKTLEDTLATSWDGQALVHDYPPIALAATLEGHPHVASQHAAGIVLVDGPITDFVALDNRSGVVWCDKKAAEDLNLLKIDCLGLTQMSIFERCLELIGQSPTSGWLEARPLDDPLAFAVLNRGHYAGVFQFAGAASGGLSNQITYERLDDLIAVTALARPGPSAQAPDWIRRHQKREQVPFVHPRLAEITAETYGVVIYQEQLMRIVREIGGFSWEETSKIRRLFSLKMGNEALAAYRGQFVQGASENQMGDATAGKLWDQLVTFGTYGFNKAHATAYAIVSYWCLWLKAYYPVEYAAASLDAEPDADKQLLLLRELQAEGVDYIPVDVERSTERWTPITQEGRRILVGPLTAIRGIGPVKVQEVLEARRLGTPMKPALQALLEGAATELDHLYPVKTAIERLVPDPAAFGIATMPRQISELSLGDAGVVVIGLVKRINRINENDTKRVERRGYKMYGPTDTIAFWLQDDTGEIYCAMDRYDFQKYGEKLLSEVEAGKSMVVVKGNVPSGFRMISLWHTRYIGEIKEEEKPLLDIRVEVAS